MNEGRIPDGIIPPAGWNRPEPLRFDFSRFPGMPIDELSQLIHLPIDNVPGAPPPSDTPDEETIDPQTPDLTITPDPTKMRAHRQVVGMENAGVRGSPIDSNNGTRSGMCKVHTMLSPPSYGPGSCSLVGVC